MGVQFPLCAPKASMNTKIKVGDIVSVIPNKGAREILVCMFDDECKTSYAEDVYDWVMQNTKFRVMDVKFDTSDSFHQKMSFNLRPVCAHIHRRDTWWFPNYTIKFWREREDGYDPEDD